MCADAAAYLHDACATLQAFAAAHELVACLLLGSSPQLLGSLLGLHDSALPTLQAAATAAAASSPQQLPGGASQVAQVSMSPSYYSRMSS